jgi:ADP-ribose pyrophosphatase YjhB (NUDIX family)
VLLVRHKYGAGEGRWALPGGLVTHDERLDQAAVREVREETGLDTEPLDIIGLLTRYTGRGGFFGVVFRLRPVFGELRPDGVEIDRVAYFSEAEIRRMGDEELLPRSRNAAIAAVSDRVGLPEDKRFPLRAGAFRAFLVHME